MITLHTESSGAWFFLCCYSSLSIALICLSPCPHSCQYEGERRKGEDEGIPFSLKGITKKLYLHSIGLVWFHWDIMETCIFLFSLNVCLSQLGLL